MQYEEIYQFDLAGYLLVPKLLDAAELDPMLQAVDRLEAHVLEKLPQASTRTGQFGVKYFFDEAFGTSSYALHTPGLQVVVDDCIGAAEAFDALIGHPKLMPFINDMVLGPHSITSAEIRLRYKENKTTSHMGGPIDVRSRYSWIGGKMTTSDGTPPQIRYIDLVNCRMMIALHDIGVNDGPFCLVPGSHKANLRSPYSSDPHAEPGMLAVPMKKGDVLFFTENMRHGGLTNVSGKARKSIHLMYSQSWVSSQSPVHFNGHMRIHRTAWNRYSEAQKAFFPNAEIVG